MAEDVLEDKTWLNAGKMMVDTYKHLERIAEEKEKFAEVYEANRILQLRSDRANILRNESQINRYIPYGIDLGIMTDEDFTNILNGAKLQRDAQIAAEQKAESERLALLKKQEDERIAMEKKRAAEQIAMEQENERLRLENIEKDKAMKAAQAKAKEEKDRQDATIEKERQEAAQKAKEIELKNEEQMRIEREKSENELRLAIQEKEKAESALKAQKEAEEKEKAEKIRLEKLAQKKAASASDNEKIKKFVADIEALEIPVCKYEGNVLAINSVKETLNQLAYSLKTIASEKITI